MNNLKNSGVYIIRCKKTKKVYIGSTINFRTRKNSHFIILRKKQHHSIHLQRSFDKHGESSFVFEIVEKVHDTIFLRAREQFWMWRFSGLLYNCSPMAHSPIGVKRTAAFKKAYSKRMMGNTLRLGQKMPPGYSEMIKKRMAGNSFRSGKLHSEVDKNKIRQGVKKAYAEGRHKPADKIISSRNIASWNEKIKSGEIKHPRHNPEKVRAVCNLHLKTGSLKKVGEEFNMRPSSAWELVKKYAPHQKKGEYHALSV